LSIVTNPIDAIAEKLVEAAYDNNGRPPDRVGLYIANIAQQQDVPAYFRKKAALYGKDCKLSNKTLRFPPISAA
jgi:hypothetical protein